MPCTTTNFQLKSRDQASVQTSHKHAVGQLLMVCYRHRSRRHEKSPITLSYGTNKGTGLCFKPWTTNYPTIAYLTHVLLCGEHQLMVQHPVRLLLKQGGRWVDKHRLLFHHGLVSFLGILACCVVKEAAANGFLDKVSCLPTTDLLQVVSAG